MDEWMNEWESCLSVERALSRTNRRKEGTSAGKFFKYFFSLYFTRLVGNERINICLGNSFFFLGG